MLKLLKVGHCYHPEAMVLNSGSWQSIQFPSIVGLIKHPSKGYVLFDTGYAQRFFSATRPFPERIYRWITPPHLSREETLTEQLHQLDIGVDDINAIFISHFHADHVAGLLDFPHASFICSKQAFSAVIKKGRLARLTKAYLPSLLPSDFLQRAKFIEDSKLINIGNHYKPFSNAYDIFEDGSIAAISLPGHAAGHYGILFESNRKTQFLIGDACWTKQAYEKKIKPNRLSHIIMDNGREYLNTLNKLSEFFVSNREVQIIPSHCRQTFEEYYGD